MARIEIAAEGDRKAFTIYANRIEALNAFLTDPEADATLGDKVVKTKTIKGHQRRRGPSDENPINVLQSTADYLYDPTLKSGNAKPGFSFRLQTTANADVDYTRQFTMVGNTVDFIEYFDEKMKYETYVYFSIGGRHTLAISPIGGGGG